MFKQIIYLLNIYSQKRKKILMLIRTNLSCQCHVNVFFLNAFINLLFDVAVFFCIIKWMKCLYEITFKYKLRILEILLCVKYWETAVTQISQEGHKVRLQDVVWLVFTPVTSFNCTDMLLFFLVTSIRPAWGWAAWISLSCMLYWGF